MDANQIGILNSLVTFAAENVPGGLSNDEQQVAQLVGQHALHGDILRTPHPIPIAITNKKGPVKIHYLRRDNIHQTVCGLPTEKMQRYFSVDIHIKRRCASCEGREEEAANL